MAAARGRTVQVGILGKANVGKSTFFSAATETDVPTGNFPFTTVKPNVGVAHVRAPCPCKGLGIPDHDHPSCSAGTRLIPVRLVDVAGLVPGAHEGKGLGNQFLDDARQAAALVHVVDAAGTTDLQGQPVPAGTHDPAEDVVFVEAEFDMWIAGILRREWPKLTRETDQKAAGATEAIARRLSGLGVGEAEVKDVVASEGLAGKRPAEWSDDDLSGFASALRRRTRPIVIAANKADLCADAEAVARRLAGAGEGGSGGGGESGGRRVVPCSAEADLLLRRAARAGAIRYAPGSASFEPAGEGPVSEAQKRALALVSDTVLARLGTTGVQEALEEAVFGLLGMIVAYPVEDEGRYCRRDGTVLPEALLLPPGSTAKDLAAAVHADLAGSFLHAIDCRKRQRIGAGHELADGDVVKVVSTAARG